MTDAPYDLFVIGAGSGGTRAARRAAERGARVAIAEADRFGGTCVIRGCVPKKLLVYASGFSEALEAAGGFGWNIGTTSFDWSTLIANKDAEIARLEGLYREGLANAGVTIFEARAELAGPGKVRVAGHEGVLEARETLIATGGAPFVPEFPGREFVSTSNDAFGLSELPQRVVIVGGGYIACEFACIFRGLGSEVVQLYRGPLFLRGFDEDLRNYAARELRRQGIDLRFGTEVAEVRRANDGVLQVRDTAGDTRMADFVLYATGRRPSTAGLGLAAAGVDLGRGGEIVVDEFSASSVPGIHAIGDVTDRLNQTPVAIREGEAFVQTVFGGNPTRPDHALVPLAVFTQPELSTVGLTEEEARRVAEVEIYRAEFRPLFETLAGVGAKTLMKLVVDRNSRRVLGVHVGGHGAAEMVQCLAIAVKMGATKEDFDRTCALHPTSAEELVTMRTPVGTTG